MTPTCLCDTGKGENIQANGGQGESAVEKCGSMS